MVPPNPEALSRRISEIDLTARGPKDTLPEYGPRYSPAVLLKLRSANHDGSVEIPDFKLDGVMTPPSISHPAVPPTTPTHHMTPTQHMSESDAEREDEGLALLEEEKKKKKKKKKSSGAGKSKKAITGFEEFFADPPITPDEYEEECDLYDQSRPFHERIQTCIQRYRRRRNLDETRALIFTKYLILGGVEASSSKSFTGGLDKETIENSTAAEIAAIQATDFIRTGSTNSKYYDPLKPDGWVVDFEGVVKGFLSYHAPRHIGDSNKQISSYCNVIKNFLNYVISHAVCPEYAENILAARTICDRAEKELLALNCLRQILPGDFNVAASTLYGGRYSGNLIANQEWGSIDPAANRGFDEAEAQIIFKSAIALTGTDEMFKAVMEEDIEIISTQNRYFEVIEIELPGPDAIAQYMSVEKQQGKPGHFKALGLLRVKTWEGPGLEDEDVTDYETNGDSTTEGSIETFWLESDILKHCFVGLKLEVTVHKLNIGVKFFDYVPSLYCSFFVFLPQEKMRNWKEPAINFRAPPTEDDPDADEKAMIGEMERDIDDDEKIGEILTIKTNMEKSGTEHAATESNSTQD